MISQSEAGAGTWRGYLELINYFFPQLIVGNSIWPASGDDGFVEFAQV